MRPVPVKDRAQMEREGYGENWICYRAKEYSAKELTVLPGKTVTIRDAAAYGMIVLQGHGTMGAWAIESPAIIRFGQATSDEFFVSRGRQKRISVKNIEEIFRFFSKAGFGYSFRVFKRLARENQPPFYHVIFFAHFSTGVLSPLRMDSLIPGIERR